ncbi:MAG: hypothetical protein LQ351_000183 [Letrouitia transgressa]|nr:MAG: hypothetical protein LQ351_000183 [Letrouitia transgressa]
MTADVDLCSDQDDRPLAVRRKRRSSTGLVDPRVRATEEANKETGMLAEIVPASHSKTPSKPKKRVRFSDPGPESSHATSSTGLTPALKRAVLNPSLLPEKARRRSSMPAQLSTPSPSPVSPLFPIAPTSGQIQFAPLRQIIDSRTTRRLKRNHLSEEINDIYDSKKFEADLQDEVQALRQELATVRHSSTDERQGSAKVLQSNGRLEELENELASLKQEMREKSVTAEPSLSGHSSAEPATPSSSIYGGIEDEDFPMVGVSEDLKETTGTPVPSQVAEAATHASLPDPNLFRVFRSARLSLERLYPGETPLGLDVSDPRLILDAMLARIQTLKAELIFAQNNVTMKETQESNLRNQFNSALAQLERARNYGETLSAELTKEKARTVEAEQKVEKMLPQLQEAKVQMNEAEMESSQLHRSVVRFQNAANKYESEVKQLEKLITEMETSHQTEVFNIRTSLTADFNKSLNAKQSFMDETVTDLECQVAAETAGRHAAEKSAVERLQQIKQLEGIERELRGAMNDKQSVIRDLEAQLHDNAQTKEREVGQLNVRIANLSSSLQAAEADLQNLQIQKNELIKLVGQEKVAGIKAVEAMQAEMKKCTHNVDGVKESHVQGVMKRSEEVAEHKGLLTPMVEGGRFKDAEMLGEESVEGAVEIERGKGRKSRPDSGICVLMEEIEESS